MIMGVYRNYTRTESLFPMKLDFKNLKIILEFCKDKVNEAKEIQIKNWESPEDEKAKENKKEIGDNFKMTVTFYEDLEHGEGALFDDIEIIDDNQLHSGISKINIESSYRFRNHYNVEPLNFLEITFDFNTNNIFDFRNLSNTKFNRSYVKVSGIDSTWVNGVFDQLIKKIKKLRTSRKFIHKNLSSDLLIFFLLFPFILWVIYNIDQVLVDKIKDSSGVFFTLIYIYIALLSIYFYRITYNLIKMLYPYIECSVSTKKAWVRRIISTILLGLIVKLFYDVFNIITTNF